MRRAKGSVKGVERSTVGDGDRIWRTGCVEVPLVVDGGERRVSLKEEGGREGMIERVQKTNHLREIAGRRDVRLE